MREMLTSSQSSRFARRRLLMAGGVVLGGVFTVASMLGGGGVGTGRFQPAVAMAAPATNEIAGKPATSTSLVVYGDTVRAGEGLSPEQEDLACVPQLRYARSTTILWRVRVVDPDTGRTMGPGQVATLTLTLADGTVIPFHPHPPTDDGIVDWRATWTVPADYPTGELDYTVAAVDQQGRTGVMVPLGPVLIVPAGPQ